MRLNLDAFKAQTDSKQIEELEMLSGGILGACHHCTTVECNNECIKNNDPNQ